MRQAMLSLPKPASSKLLFASQVSYEKGCPAAASCPWSLSNEALGFRVTTGFVAGVGAKPRHRRAQRSDLLLRQLEIPCCTLNKTSESNLTGCSGTFSHSPPSLRVEPRNRKTPRPRTQVLRAEREQEWQTNMQTNAIIVFTLLSLVGYGERGGRSGEGGDENWQRAWAGLDAHF